MLDGGWSRSRRGLVCDQPRKRSRGIFLFDPPENALDLGN